jgi:malonyl CoA-acyl carrier protein transacylase
MLYPGQGSRYLQMITEESPAGVGQGGVKESPKLVKD